jgi:hypothetical protein
MLHCMEKYFVDATMNTYLRMKQLLFVNYPAGFHCEEEYLQI